MRKSTLVLILILIALASATWLLSRPAAPIPARITMQRDLDDRELNKGCIRFELTRGEWLYVLEEGIPKTSLAGDPALMQKALEKLFMNHDGPVCRTFYYEVRGGTLRFRLVDASDPDAPVARLHENLNVAEMFSAFRVFAKSPMKEYELIAGLHEPPAALRHRHSQIQRLLPFISVASIHWDGLPPGESPFAKSESLPQGLRATIPLDWPAGMMAVKPFAGTAGREPSGIDLLHCRAQPTSHIDNRYYNSYRYVIHPQSPAILDTQVPVPARYGGRAEIGDVSRPWHDQLPSWLKNLW